MTLKTVPLINEWFGYANKTKQNLPAYHERAKPLKYIFYTSHAYVISYIRAGPRESPAPSYHNYSRASDTLLPRIILQRNRHLDPAVISWRFSSCSQPPGRQRLELDNSCVKSQWHQLLCRLRRFLFQGWFGQFYQFLRRSFSLRNLARVVGFLLGSAVRTEVICSPAAGVCLH